MMQDLPAHRISQKGKAAAIFLLFFLVGGALPLRAVDISDQADLAIVADSPELEDLLVPALGDIKVVTRRDLPSISREQILVGGNLALLGARTVLILEGAPPTVTGRLVEADSGATIAEFRPPVMPVGQLAGWLAIRLPEAVKAATSPDRPRLALLGLRFDLDSPDNRLAERSANLMLTAGLQDAGAVVLERWRMRDLVFEKSLSTTASPFWSAAALVEGSLSRNNEGFVLRLRREESNGQTICFELHEGSLRELVAKAVHSLTNTAPGTTDQSPRIRESGAFLSEARWLLNHGLAMEAWQAAEAAIALGAKGTGAEMLRVKAAAMTAYPDNLRSSHEQDGGYRADAFSVNELPYRVAAATEMSLLACDYIRRHATTKRAEWWTLEHPSILGVHSLYTGLRVLRFTHDSGWHRDHPESVRDLRSALKAQIDLLKASSLHSGKFTFFNYLTNYAGYWNETPAEAIAFYRLVLDPEFPAGISAWPRAVRAELAYNSDLPHPPLLNGVAKEEDFPFGTGSWRVVAWDGSDLTNAWVGFLNELAASDSVLERADALALRWQSTGAKQARLEITRQMADFLHENFETMQGPHGPAIFASFLPALRDVNADKGLAASQHRLVDFFLRILQSEGPLPPEILPKVWCAFSDRKLNAHEEQAKILLEAVSGRLSISNLSSSESKDLSAAQSAIHKSFPQLRGESRRDRKAITAKGPWIACEHLPDHLRWRIGFSPETGVWFRNALVVLDPHHARIWTIDPSSGGAGILEAVRAPDVNHGSQLLVWDDRLVVTTESGISLFDPENRSWQTLNLPPARYVAAVVSGGLWAAAGESQNAGREKEREGTQLFRIGRDLVPVLVGSSRRRPALHPLDTLLAGRPFAILPSESGGVLIGCHGEWRTFVDSETGLAPEAPNRPFLGNIRLSSDPRVIVRCKHRGGDRNRLARVELFESGGVEVLLSHPELDGGDDPRFEFPRSLDAYEATEFAVAWDGERLAVLAWSAKGSPWGATSAKLFEITEHGYEEFDVAFPFSMEIESRLRESRNDPKVFQYPHPDPGGLIPTPQGYVITGRGMQGFWFLPMAMVRAVPVANQHDPR